MRALFTPVNASRSASVGVPASAGAPTRRASARMVPVTPADMIIRAPPALDSRWSVTLAIIDASPYWTLAQWVLRRNGRNQPTLDGSARAGFPLNAGIAP